MKCVFSVDVEDWFHILDVPSTPPMSAWDSLPSRIEGNFLKLLDLFTEKRVLVTCFFLGWVARRFPHLVREAAKRGHEVASHGDCHRLAFEMGEDEFYRDAVQSRKTLEDVVGHPVMGYRASGFSVTEKTPWFFEKLIEAGYQYDSSVFPAPRDHGGLRTEELGPYGVDRGGATLIEFPVTVTTLLGIRLCLFGGGYLRLFPYSLIKRMAARVLAENRPVVFYMHPREVDPDHPRLPMGWKRRFKSYVNLDRCEPKIRRLLDEFQFTTFQDYLRENLERLTPAAPRSAVPFGSEAGRLGRAS